MSHIRGADRSEVLLFPPALDDYITQDNPVRFIEAFVPSLDLVDPGFTRATPAATGGPGYDPAGLSKLYVYGYPNRIRPSRLLEREAARDVEVTWLLGGLTPDFKTVADFRGDNLEPLKRVCREFTLPRGRLDLFGGEPVAIGGGKFRADNGRGRNFNPPKLERITKAPDERISTHPAEMGRQDAAGPSATGTSVEGLRAKIEQLKRRGRFHEEIAERPRESGAQETSPTDPDSRLMSVGRGPDVCYNVRTAVESKHKLIARHEVTNAHTDEGCLVGVATKAKGVLEAGTLEAVADKGYYAGEEIKRCEEQGIVTFIPKVRVVPGLKDQLFTRGDFRYDPLTYTYTCPEGARLTHRFTTPERNGVKQRYYRTTACKTCAARPVCTENNRGRTIERLMGEDVLERMARRLKTHPEKMRLRGQLVEHPSGTMKRGRKRLRTVVIQAVLSMVNRTDTPLMEFYRKKKREKGAGKAICATARKLLTIIFVLLKKELDYWYLEDRLYNRKLRALNAAA
jgi:transposase